MKNHYCLPELEMLVSACKTCYCRDGPMMKQTHGVKQETTKSDSFTTMAQNGHGLEEPPAMSVSSDTAVTQDEDATEKYLL